MASKGGFWAKKRGGANLYFVTKDGKVAGDHSGVDAKDLVRSSGQSSVAGEGYVVDGFLVSDKTTADRIALTAQAQRRTGEIVPTGIPLVATTAEALESTGDRILLQRIGGETRIHAVRDGKLGWEVDAPTGEVLGIANFRPTEIVPFMRTGRIPRSWGDDTRVVFAKRRADVK